MADNPYHRSDNALPRSRANAADKRSEKHRKPYQTSLRLSFKSKSLDSDGDSQLGFTDLQRRLSESHLFKPQSMNLAEMKNPGNSCGKLLGQDEGHRGSSGITQTTENLTGEMPSLGDLNARKSRSASAEFQSPKKKNLYATVECHYSKQDVLTSEKELEGDFTDHICLFDLAWEDILFEHVLPHLTWEDLFHLRRVSHKALRLVQEYFSQIRSLDLSSIQLNFSQLAFQVVSENCRNLHRLVVHDASWIQDVDLIRVFKSNHHLVYVDISGCVQLKGPCLLALAVNCKKVATLLLRNCSWITKGAVETLIAHLRKLQAVDFTSCAALTNFQIFPLAQAYPRLSRIHLAQIQSVNDATLAMIARQCRELSYLDIRSCMCVTDNGIRAVAEYCTQLKTLKVEGCHLVTEYSLTLLRSRATVTIDRPCSDFFHHMPQILIPRVQV